MRFVIILSFFLPICACAQEKIPDAALRTLDGKAVNLSDYTGQGKPVLISFWATWCRPCHTELDQLKGEYPSWQEAYDVEMLAITIDNARQLPQVQPMVEAKGWPYRVLSDPTAQLQRSLGFRAIPQLYLVDGSGRIVYQHSGYTPEIADQLENQLRSLR